MVFNFYVFNIMCQGQIICIASPWMRCNICDSILGLLVSLTGGLILYFVRQIVIYRQQSFKLYTAKF